MAEPRTEPRQAGDTVIGCGKPADGQTSGRSCAGTGTEPSCQLCPDSPTYWAKQDRTCAVCLDQPAPTNTTRCPQCSGHTRPDPGTPAQAAR